MTPHLATGARAAFALTLASLTPLAGAGGEEGTPTQGAFCRGAIGDFVWRDSNGNGLQDPDEPGIDGVLVRLLDPEGLVLETTISGPNGFYAFLRRCAGTYFVEVDESTLPIGLVPSPCDVGANDARDSECSPVLVVLADNFATNRGIDFGFRPGGNGRIGDRVWEDSDCDGLQDLEAGLVVLAPEEGIARVRIILRDDMGVILEETRTDGGGRYEFNNLPDGRYIVEVDEASLPAGLFPAPCQVGLDPERDNDCSPALVVLGASLGASSALSIDFGYRRAECVGEGCSQGYWRNHPAAWPAPYSPTLLFSDVFDDAFPGKTLGQVVRQGGGGLNALGRQVVAALLNAASLEVEFALEPWEVIGLFDEVFDERPDLYESRKDYFEALNLSGCPL